MSRLNELFSSFFEKNIKKIFRKKIFIFFLGFCRLWEYFLENFWSRLCVSSWTWGSIFEKSSYDCLFRFFKISQKSCEKLKIEFLAKNTLKSGFSADFEIFIKSTKNVKKRAIAHFLCISSNHKPCQVEIRFFNSFLSTFCQIWWITMRAKFFSASQKYFQLLFSCFFQITNHANFFADFQTAFSWNISFDPKIVFYVCFLEGDLNRLKNASLCSRLLVFPKIERQS